MLESITVPTLFPLFYIQLIYCDGGSYFNSKENSSIILDGNLDISFQVRSIIECAFIIATDPVFKGASFTRDGKICRLIQEMAKHSEFMEDSVVITGYTQGII